MTAYLNIKWQNFREGNYKSTKYLCYSRLLSARYSIQVSLEYEARIRENY